MDIAIQTTSRSDTGKGPNRRLRESGRIPAVAYGHGIDAPISVTLDPKELEKALKNPWGMNALFDLEVDGEGTSHKVLAREIQRHPVTRRFLHVDFVAPDPERPIVAFVPVKVVGKSAGVTKGGKLETTYRELKILARPGDVPVEIEVDVTPLEVGDQFRADKLVLPEGVTAIYDRPYVVVQCVESRAMRQKAQAERAEEKKK